MPVFRVCKEEEEEEMIKAVPFCPIF